MARTYKTDPPHRVSERRAERDADGKPRLPPIKQRRPHHGDVHPVPAKVLRKWLRDIAPHYYYGLRRIELKPRPGEIGRPYGYYSPHDREVVLYSLPMEWRMDIFAAGELRKYGAEFEFDDDDDCLVRWPEHARLGLWFFHTVVTHELGHHYAEIYHPRNGRVSGRDPAELVAELHSYRLSLDWWTRGGADKADAKRLAAPNSVLRAFRAQLDE